MAMAKIDGDVVELTDGDASIAKGMLERGDHQHHIASYFGVDSRAISHLKNGKTFVATKPAPLTSLPPPGPYKIDPSYALLYRRMSRINDLWENRKLKEAKALLESTLRSPLLEEEQGFMDELANDLLRDEYGLL
jgi:transcriptional regulator with XRE-family HTH domain